ncbi:uncharacterized protein TNCV_1249751 [Trichonephila clavipes]|nr:uncharacterized protein TNCV_1249751 [Trichonephila clavipes]
MCALTQMLRLGRYGLGLVDQSLGHLDPPIYRASIAFLWGHLKILAYVTSLDSDEVLVARISKAATRVSEVTDIFERVCQSLRRRSHACIASGGRNFEQLFSHNRLDHSMKLGVVGRLKTGQSQAEARWLQMAPKVVSWSWNQFQTSATVIKMVGEGRPTATTPAQDRYMALRTQRHRRTMSNHFARDLAAWSGRISRHTVYTQKCITDFPIRQSSSVCFLLNASNREDQLLWRQKH